MISIALFPCSYIDGARLVGELSNALQGRMYTDALLIEDVSEKYGIAERDIRKWLYDAPSPNNRLTLEKNKYVNLFKHFLVEKIARTTPHLFYGFLASLIGPEIKDVLKILVVDTLAGRVERAMQQEGYSESKAVNVIYAHDQRVAQWTRFLFGKEPYDYSLYDSVISYDSRNVLAVKEEIVAYCLQHESELSNAVREQRAEDMAIAAAVERVLLERGYKAGVHISAGAVALSVEVSQYNFPRFEHKLTELTRSVQGVKDVRVERSV